MIELLVTLCLTARPDICVDRLLPGPCVEARAQDWAATHPDLALRGWRCAEPEAAVEPLPVVEVAEGVFVHQGPHALPSADNGADWANVGFIVGRDAVAVIDAGGARGVGERLYAAVRARTDLPIEWLILTHMHPDHVLGASVFAEAGAQVIGHARLGPALLSRAEAYIEGLERQAGPAVAIGSSVVLPDATVADRLEIDLGDRVLVLEAQPTAHTDNDLTVLDRRTGTWFMGDLVFAGQVPVVDGSALGWLDVLGDLTARPAARIVPGHGPAEMAWPQAAAPTQTYLSGLVARTREAIAAGESLGDAAPRLGQDLRGDWALFDEFNARNATTVYRELEWE